ncbi:4-hydroxy-tetrahydrodipicolinate synthase [Marchantia polymorpha subsp. ruderalis]|uniref:4-hydroxy-tetrahydrodipicolinate synthase n=2 Tax=Marchantia polymorpha TaxID=3197 RepID=A0AAF6ASN6_MARPO|nr:hypothetical protein MARPO_0001s0476 [Marchantia polymorpha]BBM99456.1 hypothetical protein Mp_1g21410 [Marchantia polymorpha subsp. ruderalis]|eukprot:PTQ50538.1 hypothetical protein MARPO_0001s0476 [Marchantia polymorpha]
MERTICSGPTTTAWPQSRVSSMSHGELFGSRLSVASPRPAHGSSPRSIQTKCRSQALKVSSTEVSTQEKTLSARDLWAECGTESKTFRSVDDIKKLRLITAVKTPYLECGRFDLAAYDKLVRCQILNKVEGIIVGGTTGEGQLMSWDDHIRLIAHSVTCFGDEICIIGNTGSNATNEAIKATEAGFDVGMHAALHINPYYGKTSRRGMLEHFDKVIGMGPSIIYNVPGRTGQDIPTEIVEQLAKGKHFAGIKECMGHDRVKHYAERNIEVWSGNDDECHDSRWIHGGRGVISVVSNLVPGLMHELLHTGRDDALNARLQPLITWLFKEPNPIGLNTALSQLQVIKPVFRLPYYPLCQAMREEFVKIVNDIGREHFIGSEEVMVLEDDDFKIVDRY